MPPVGMSPCPIDGRRAVRIAPWQHEHVTMPVDRHSSPAAKIALFRSLFRGRDDLYPRRFESRKTGRSGYAPACANEWVRGVCEKPRIKCAECPQRRFLPVTDDVIRWHLSGRDDTGQPFVAGIYPMLLDETCFFLAIDFDKSGWKEDAAAFLDTCRSLRVPAAIERSRSGNGGHVWLFFEEAVQASLARRLGAHILTETMERHPEIGFDSYDRFFPNQDTLPAGGFGNLIALPLQKAARDRMNSLFLDDRLEPHDDQWAFLSSVERIGRTQIEQIVHEAERRGRVLNVRLPLDEDDDAPWTAPPSRQRQQRLVRSELPATLELVLGNQIYIPKDQLSPRFRNRLLRIAAFQNPDFYKAQAMRLPAYGKPRIIACAEEHSHHLGLPRGCLDELRQLLEDLDIEPLIRDERQTGQPLDVTFRGTLQPEQEIAAKAMLAHDCGVLAATTAFGKTVVASWLIARRAVNTLVLVHRRQLLEQWVERLAAFLDIPAARIGRIEGGRNRPNGLLDVAILQSLVRKGVVDDRLEGYGHLIVDECHHVPARSFELLVRQAKARFVTGLSATVARKDGHHPIIFMQCGPVRYRVSAKSQAAARPFEHKVVVRTTGFQTKIEPESDARVALQSLYRELAECEERNRIISEDVISAVEEGRTPLVLTERTSHLDRLAAMLAARISNVVVLRGGMSRREQRATAEQLTDGGSVRVILATGRYIGEGFDHPQLDTLFVTLPVSWKGTIAQYAGRLHRLCHGKHEVRVYDYADLGVPLLARMFDRRCRGYEAIGYTIRIPASVRAGWPVEVPLPADPAWTQTFSASVQRLIRDGIDTPLASLFADLTLPLRTNREPDRARSATEAFLYRRLETIAETRGRFQLNANLPVAFDGWGQMEVDLLCAEHRIAIEIDGPQHLSDPVAYRRDRRKDQLLQENGYLVLRYLAEDVGSDLSRVLDGILRALSHRVASNTRPDS
jgi:superfamily II DNA or RNA helicase/very-short-patch-repair endonuclease